MNFNIFTLIDKWYVKHQVDALYNDLVQGITVRDHDGALHIFVDGSPAVPLSVIDEKYRNDLKTLLSLCRNARLKYEHLKILGHV